MKQRKAPSIEHARKIAEGKMWYQQGLFGKITDPKNVFVNRARTRVLKDFYKNNPLPNGYFNPESKNYGIKGAWDTPPTWEDGYNAEQQKIIELAKIKNREQFNNESNADATASDSWGDYRVENGIYWLSLIHI